MKLTKCEKNHFYDSDKYKSCPHCGKTSSSTACVASSAVTGQRDSTLGGQRRVTGQPVVSFGFSQAPARSEDGERTEAIIDGARRNSLLMETPVCQDAVVTDDEGDHDAGCESPLLKSVSEVRETVHYEETKTVAFYDNAEEPVVGWLVCVRGEYFGMGFPIKTGKNMIGRSSRMDIALTKEVSVSRDRHAILIYEPKKKQFFIQPGEGNGLTYVNEDLLMVPQEIHDYDVIQIGNVAFALRTLCGEKFSWETYIESEG